MKTSYATLIVAILVAVGGWAITLPSWSVACQPTNIGGLLMGLGSVAGAWFAKSPRGGAQ